MDLPAKRRFDLLLGGLGILFLRPAAVIAGSLLRRNHDPRVRGDIGVVKALGGGSLVLAAGSLLGIRRRYPDAAMLLVTTPAVLPFASALGLFDEILVVDDRGISSLLATGLKAWWRLLQTDTILDLEPYSRLSTVLTTLSCARNRFTFFLESAYWRKGIATHLVFLNRASRMGLFYESVARAVDAPPVERDDVARHVAGVLGLPLSGRVVEGRITACREPGRVCLGPTCSGFGQERMLSPGQWLRVLKACLPDSAREIVVLGGSGDRQIAESVIEAARVELPRLQWSNACDGRPLRQALGLLAESGHFIGIDSGLLHFARLFGVPSRSFWGPTDPATRLDAPRSSWDRAYYTRTPCSPCIHIAETPPCAGVNLCMEAAVLAATDPQAAPGFAAAVPVPLFAR